MLSGLWQDVKYGARWMRRRPGFSSIVVLVLALGIGVNTALFSVVSALFLTPLPVRDPHRLFYVYQRPPDGRTFAAGMSADELKLLAGHTRALAEYAAHAQLQAVLTIEGDSELQTGESVSGNYFAFLGVGTVIGRPLGPADNDPASPPAVVISHALWARRFQSDSSALGRQVRINDEYVSIVGVAARSFYGVTNPLSPSHFWVAGAQVRGEDWRGVPIGRLEARVSFAQLETAILALTPALAELHLEQRRRSLAEMGGTVSDQFVTRIRRTQFPVRRASDVEMPSDPELRLIPRAVVAGVIGIVALVLLIATANITGLLLARGVTRTDEVAVRRALGAHSARLVRQLLTESVVLSLVGGLLGLGLATILVGVFRANAPARYALEATLDIRVLLFGAGICLLTGLLTGLAPARQAARVNVLHAMGGAVAAGGAVRRRLRHAIVVPQVALSLVLLIVAAVQTRGLLGIELMDRGYHVDGATVFGSSRITPRTLDLEESRRWRERLPGLARDIAERVQDLPGVTAVGLTSRLPLGAGQGGARLVTEAGLAAGAPPRIETPWIAVTGGYFNAMGMQVRGRTFDRRDSATTGKVAVVSESLARSLWPVGDPIGQRFAFMQGARPGEWKEVIGVVNDVRPVLGADRDIATIYLPVDQAPFLLAATTLVVRAVGDHQALVRAVKQAIRDAEPLLEVLRIQTLSQIIGELLYPRRLATTVLVATGVIGLLLACIGLYGVVSYSVEQRAREIGIRATLGAERPDIVSLILRDGLAVIAWGGIAGLGVAALSLRWASRAVPGVWPGDFVSYVAVTGALAVIVAAACLVPAVRASRVDPARVLRGL